MLISICRNLIKITRLTSELFATQATASSISVVNGTPNVNSNVQVILNRPGSGYANTLAVTVLGNIKSGEDTYTMVTEQLDFEAPLAALPTKVLVTSKQYTNISSFTMTGSAIATDFTIGATYVGADGGNVFCQSVVVDGYPAAITRRNEKWPDKIYGSATKEGTSMLLPYTAAFEIRTGDVVTNTVTNEEYLVVGTPLIESFVGNQFTKVLLEKRDKSLQ